VIGKRMPWRVSVWFVLRFLLYVALGGTVVVWNEGQRVMLELYKPEQS
jgi:hypothetical protein